MTLSCRKSDLFLDLKCTKSDFDSGTDPGF